MAVLKWLIAGLVGAGIGGAVWVGVGYFMNMEVSYIAIGIGLLAGLGVRRTMASDEVNPAAGIAAVAAALLVVALSKYIVARMQVDEILGQMLAAQVDVNPIDYVADEIITERIEAGQEVNWPEPAEGEDPELAEFAYPGRRPGGSKDTLGDKTGSRARGVRGSEARGT